MPLSEAPPCRKKGLCGGGEEALKIRDGASHIEYIRSRGCRVEERRLPAAGGFKILHYTLILELKYVKHLKLREGRPIFTDK